MANTPTAANLTIYEKDLTAQGFALIGGADEVGRGCLAGPVVACIVVLPPGYCREGIFDSKRLSEKKREHLAPIIRNEAVSYAFGICSPQTIDEINILEATRLAMTRAYDALLIKPDFLLVDALTLPDVPARQLAVKKGDQKSISIAAASITAKVYRDNLMCRLHEKYPMYGFAQNKGYGTARHIEALRNIGPCEAHRVSFLSNII